MVEGRERCSGVFPVEVYDAALLKCSDPSRCKSGTLVSVEAIPNLVAERDLTAANSLDSLGEEVPSLIGPLLGGVLLGAVGLSGLVLLDVGTYLASAFLISMIGVPTAAPEEEEPDVTPEVAVSAWANALKEWLGGLRLIGRDRSIAVLFGVILAATVGEGAVTVMLIIYFRDVFGSGAQEFSYFVAAYGVGGILGGILLGGSRG